MKETQRPDRKKAEHMAYAGKPFRDLASFYKISMRQGSIIGINEQTIETLLKQADAAESATGHHIDLFRKLTESASASTFFDRFYHHALMIGLDDEAQEINFLRSLPPEERFLEYEKRVPQSPFSYTVHMIETLGLAIVDDKTEKREITVSKPTIELIYEGDDDLSANNNTKNITELLDLENNGLKKFGIQVALTRHEAPQGNIPAGEKGIPYLTLTINKLR